MFDEPFTARLGVAEQDGNLALFISLLIHSRSGLAVTACKSEQVEVPSFTFRIRIITDHTPEGSADPDRTNTFVGGV